METPKSSVPPLKKLHSQELLPNVKVAVVASLGEGSLLYLWYQRYVDEHIYVINCVYSSDQRMVSLCIGITIIAF